MPADRKASALTERTLSGFLWNYLSMIIQGIVGVTCFTTLAHLLGPREFGIVGMATIFTNFVERVGFFGVGQALVQREELEEGHIRSGFVLCLLSGTVLFALFYLGAPQISEFLNEPDLAAILRLVSLSFVIASVAEVPLSLLQRDLRFKELLYITNISQFVGSGLVGVSLAFLGFSYWSLIAGILTTRTVRLVLAFRSRPQTSLTGCSWRHSKDLLQLGVGFSLGRLTNYCAVVGDNFVVGKTLGAQPLGLYSRSYQLMTAPATYLGQVLERVFFAALSQRQSEPAKVSKYFLYGIELCSLISMAGSVLLWISAEEVVTVLFGPQWLEAVPTVKILSMGTFFRTCYKNSDTVIRALGAVYRLASVQSVYAVAVVFGSILGSRWGIEGVAVAVLLALVLNYLLLSILCLRLLNLSWWKFLQAHAPGVWVGAWEYLGLSFYFASTRANHWHPLLSLAGGGALSVMIGLVFLWLRPAICAPKVFVWLGRNLGLERLGVLGRFGKQYLLREVSAETA